MQRFSSFTGWLIALTSYSIGQFIAAILVHRWTASSCDPYPVLASLVGIRRLHHVQV